MKRLLLMMLLGGCDVAAPVRPASAPEASGLGGRNPQAPAAVRTDAVPQLPDDVFERLRPYHHVRAAVFEDWTPDGKSLLVTTRFGNTPQLHRVDAPGGRPEQLTFFDDVIDTARALPGPVGAACLFSMGHGGDENFQVYRLDLARRGIARLTDGRSRNLLGPIRPGTGEAVVASNRRNGKDTDLYLLPPGAPERERMLLRADGAYWTPMDWSPDGTRLLVLRIVSIAETYPQVLDAGTGRLTPVPAPAGAPARVSWQNLRWAPDGRGVFAACDAGGEFRQLVQVDLATGESRVLSGDIPWDVEGIEIDPAGRRLAFVANEDGLSGLYLVDLASGARRRQEVPRGVIGRMKFSPDGGRLALTLARTADTTDVHVLNVEDGRRERWTTSEAGGLDASTFVEAELIRYPTFDGQRIPAWVWRPKERKGKAPVIVSIHGGPEGQTFPTFSPQYQAWLAELGAAVVAPNVRGSTGYGKTYVGLDDGRRREDSVKDIGALLDWIAAQPDLDASRVAVQGNSYGGFMVLSSLVQYGDRLRAGVSTVGVASFVTFLEHTSPYRVDLRRVEYGDERDPEMRKFLDGISPSNHADRIRSALLVAQGRNDPRVPLVVAEELVRNVRAAGRPVWYMVADDEGHGFLKKDNRDYLASVTEYFLRKHLVE